tara:strand:+ start:23170 stop:24204 length:1035 start_codon:yes stop_codon:yes gene_type:complete
MDIHNLKILVTGSAGFIGYSLVEKLIKENISVQGIDNLNNYYDVELKYARLEKLNELNLNYQGSWKFHKLSLNDYEKLDDLFSNFKPNVVVNLAAQAGVRFSIKSPASYIESNIVGFFNILELSRKHSIGNLIYASSSSVYGSLEEEKFSENLINNKPISLYAASKASNELMAYSYSSLYKIPSTGLRFFTVYGPWGRPDMAPMIFANSILSKQKINVFNNGLMERDFTYIDDVVEVIYRCCFKPAINNYKFDKNFKSNDKDTPHLIFNVGNSQPIKLLDFINLLEDVFGIKANLEFKPLQKGDVIRTSSDTEMITKWINYKPKTNIKTGIINFAKWYLEFYRK